MEHTRQTRTFARLMHIHTRVSNYELMFRIPMKTETIGTSEQVDPRLYNPVVIK